jgi:DNA-binding transcriptional ArsR family regulator
LTCVPTARKDGPAPRAADLSLEAMTRAAECLRTLAHPVRLRIVQLLLQDEYTVGELARACSVPSAVASGHLGIMRDRGLLAHKRRGRRTYYQIRQRAITGIMSCVESHFGSR